MKIVMFEPADFALLYPLTYLRPVFELRCGALTLRQKVQEKFPDCQLHLETRDALAEVARDKYGAGAVNNEERLRPDDDVLLLSGGAILTAPPASYCEREMVAATEAGHFVWAYLKSETVKEIAAPSARELASEAAGRFAPETTQDILIRYPWDPVVWNASQIAADFESVYGPQAGADLDERVALYGAMDKLHVGEGAEVEPCAFIDCRQGPVIIGADAVVSAHSSIQGPAFLGEGTRLFEARIRGGTSIGPVCRVGGEVEASIIHGYSNKCHTGFLGHSYVGEWVNIGALAATSDLKNDYSAVSAYVNGKPTDTGLTKVGSFIGDHTKTSVGTLLNTGSVVGIMCNLLAGPSVLPKYIPSFSWYLRGRISKGLGLKAALDMARTVMARRGVELTDAMIDLIKYTEGLTHSERMQSVRRDRRRAFR